MRSWRGLVSGAIATLAAARSISAMWTTNGSFSGAGAYCTSSPASNGPKPRPPMFATVATAAARPRQLSGAASMTAAVAVPVAAPADNPDSTRPSSRSSTPVATRNTDALVNAKTIASNNIGRRPTASDQRPNASSAANTPPTYVANITVVVRSEKCMRAIKRVHRRRQGGAHHERGEDVGQQREGESASPVNAHTRQYRPS
jgi:hypothetical protein